VAACRDAGQRIQHLCVDFSRVRLPCNRVRGIESHFLGDQRFQLSDFRMVAVEQFQEARLRAGCSLHAACLESFNAMLDFRQIQHQVIGPQAGPSPHGCRLRRLQVGETERRQIAISLGKVGERADHASQPIRHHLERFPNEN
jgi:hypothetical protein